MAPTNRRKRVGLAAAALDFQSLALHGGKMGAARDKGDIRAGLGQCRAKTPSDAAGADNRNTHSVSPCSINPGTARPVHRRSAHRK